jgi:hypothetical protein
LLVLLLSLLFPTLLSFLRLAILVLSLLFPTLLSFLRLAILVLSLLFPTLLSFLVFGLLLSLLLSVSTLPSFRRLFVPAPLTFRSSLLPLTLVIVSTSASPLRANQPSQCQ